MINLRICGPWDALSLNWQQANYSLIPKAAAIILGMKVMMVFEYLFLSDAAMIALAV
jgi:hypothetical protein